MRADTPAPAPAAPVTAKAPDPSTTKFGGYLQTELNLNGAWAPPYQLQARRVRLTIDAKSRDRLDGRIMLALDRFEFSLKDLYVTAYSPSVGLRVGQYYVPFAEEVLLSDSKREALERAPIARYLWPGERDMGATLTINPRTKRGASFAASVLSGNGPSRADNNAQKDLIFRYTQRFDEGRGMAYVAHQRGLFTDANGVSTARRYYGLGGTWRDKHAKWRFQGEGFAGDALGKPFLGGIARAVRYWDGGKHSVYAQLDYMDPDRNTANDTQAGPVVGYIRKLSPDTKVTFELNGRQNDGTAATDFAAGVRYQIEWD